MPNVLPKMHHLQHFALGVISAVHTDIICELSAKRTIHHNVYNFFT